MVAYLQIFWQKNAKFFQQCKFRSPEARNSMAIRGYKQSSFFSGKALQVDYELRSAAVSAPKLIKATLGGPATRMAERAVGRNRQKKKRTKKRKK